MQESDKRRPWEPFGMGKQEERKRFGERAKVRGWREIQLFIWLSCQETLVVHGSREPNGKSPGGGCQFKVPCASASAGEGAQTLWDFGHLSD